MPFLATEHVDIPHQDVLSWYWDNPRYDLNNKIYIDALNPSHHYTGHQVKTAVRQLIAGFTQLGLKPGDCVCISSFNRIEYPVLVNGIAGFGGLFTGTNPSYTPHELEHHLKTAKATIAIVEPELLPNILKAADAVGLPQSRIFVLSDNQADVPKHLRSWRHLFEHGERDWVRFNDEKTAKSTPVARLFSSGTTGLPKAADLSHYNMVAEHTLVNDYIPKPYQERRLYALPFFHASAVPHIHFSVLRKGIPAYILRRFDVDTFLKSIERHKITELGLVPPLVVMIINSPSSKKYSLKSIRHGSCGAAPLDKAAQARVQALISPDATFTQVYGMTETSCIASQLPYGVPDTSGSVGRFLPGIDVKLVDDDGKDVTDYEVRGEICLRGPLVINGYFDNPKANAASYDADGYFHTGDVGYCAKASKLWYIVDRKKELIKVRGFQVAPPELEGVLLAHPAIVDTAVIGLPDPASGSERPRGYVVVREGATLSEADVREWMATRLARYKQLDEVRFVDVIPKNASGKILKRLLRESAAKELGPKL